MPPSSAAAVADCGASSSYESAGADVAPCFVAADWSTRVHVRRVDRQPTCRGIAALPCRRRCHIGAPSGIPDEQTPRDSAGAQLIIAESKLASPEDQLFVAFLGPLTDMASAILLDPGLVDREVVVVWIGGVGYGGVESYPGVEFNLRNDIAAANVVYDSGITVWQVPSNVYSQVSVSYTELEEKIGGTSKLADYLINQTVEWNRTYWPAPIESRSLGDSPAISLMLYPRGGNFRIVPAPRFGQEGHYLPGSGHPVRVVESVDVRFLLEDMFAKIRKFGREAA
jgi:purine nucleosidase